MFIDIRYIDKLCGIKSSDTSDDLLEACISTLNKHIDEYNKEKKKVDGKDLSIPKMVDHYMEIDLYLSMIESSVKRIEEVVLMTRLDTPDVSKFKHCLDIETHLEEVMKVVNIESKRCIEILEMINNRERKHGNE